MSVAARPLIVCLLVFLLAVPALANAPRCRNGRSKDAATWLSIAHPGLGEYYLNGWGSFFENVPHRKFWLGFIPLFGWPGYLQIKSARDVWACETHDQLFD